MRHVLLIFGLCLSAGFAAGQTFGSITGEVRDPSGAVMPNASVTATNVATSVSRATATNDSGVYNFPDLNPATYQVKVSAPGFQTTTSTVEIQVQQTARVDFTLTVGQSTQTIEVSALAATLTTENATVGTVIAEKNINDLPLNGRNFFQLVALAPNVTYGFAAPPSASSRQGGDRVNQNISVAGMRGTLEQLHLGWSCGYSMPISISISRFPPSTPFRNSRSRAGIYPAEFGREACTDQCVDQVRNQRLPRNGLRVPSQRRSGCQALRFPWHQPRQDSLQTESVWLLPGRARLDSETVQRKEQLFFMSNWEGFKSRLHERRTITPFPRPPGETETFLHFRLALSIRTPA